MAVVFVVGAGCESAPREDAQPAVVVAPEVAPPVPAPAGRFTPSDKGTDRFSAETDLIREGGMRDVEALGRLLRHAEAYQPNPPDDDRAMEALRQGVRATVSLAFVAKSWTLYGPLPELRERAVANAVRLSTDYQPVVRAQCAVMLLAVRESDGEGSLTAEQNGVLETLFADREVKDIMDRELEAWREEGR